MVRPDDTRVELAEFLRDEVHQAKREMPKVGTPEHPTAWDIRHHHLDELLEDWAACPPCT